MDIIFTRQRLTRYYAMSVGTSIVGFTSSELTDRWGNQVERAVGKVTGGSVNMGILGIMNPTADAGFPIATTDLIVIEGHDNIRNVTFYQDSGAAVIYWILQTDKA